MDNPPLFTRITPDPLILRLASLAMPRVGQVLDGFDPKALGMVASGAVVTQDQPSAVVTQLTLPSVLVADTHTTVPGIRQIICGLALEAFSMPTSPAFVAQSEAPSFQTQFALPPAPVRLILAR